MGLLTARPSSAKFSTKDPCFIDIAEHPDWQCLFGNSQPIKLEIGFGMGDFLIEMAVKEPHSNFIGIDFSQEGVLKLLNLIKHLHLKNIRVAHGDVRNKIPLLFHDGELDTVFINFPDPWPRKRHKKRRLIKPGFANLVARKLAPEGHIYLATDSEPYALEILEYFNAEPSLQNINKESGFHEDRGNLPKTKYEKSFIYAGDKIHYLKYSRLPQAEKTGEKELLTEEAPLPPTQSAGKPKSNDEILTAKFKKAESQARDVCDLKQVADNLAEAGDKEWARKVYQNAEDKAQDSLDLNWLAYSISIALGDTEWAKSIYQKAEDRAESSLDLNWLAYSISETLGDTKWTRKLFKKSEDAPGNIRELCDLADSIAETFGDKEWTLGVYKKAENRAEAYSEFQELADSIYEKHGDKKWARKLYEKAEDKAEDSSDLLSLVECICEKIDNKERAIEIYNKAESTAINSDDFCDLAESLCKNLGDKEWAVRLYKKSEAQAEVRAQAGTEVEDSSHLRSLADSLCVYPGDKGWAKKVYQKAEDKSETFYEFRWLAESLCENLGDMEWAKKVYQKAEGKAKDPSDFSRLKNSRHEKLGVIPI